MVSVNSIIQEKQIQSNTSLHSSKLNLVHCIPPTLKQAEKKQWKQIPGESFNILPKVNQPE